MAAAHVCTSQLTTVGYEAIAASGITELAITRGTHVNMDSAMTALAASPTLTDVNLQSVPTLTDAGLSALGQSKSLAIIDLEAADITDKGMTALSKSVSLTNVSIMYCAVTDAGIEALLHGCSLVEMLINCINEVSSAAIAASPTMEKLYMYTDADLSAMYPHIARSTTLQELSICSRKLIRDEDAQHLSRSASMHYLRVNTPSISPSVLTKICRCSSLIDLSVRRSYLSDNHLIAIASCSSLRNLEADYVCVSDHGVSTFAKQSSVTSLSLHIRQESTVTEEGMAALAACPTLETLHLSMCPDYVITIVFARQVSQSSISVLTLRKARVSREAMTCLVSNETLTHLGVPHVQPAHANQLWIQVCH